VCYPFPLCPRRRVNDFLFLCLYIGPVNIIVCSATRRIRHTMSPYNSDAEFDDSFAGFSGTFPSLPELPLEELHGDVPPSDRILPDNDLGLEELLHPQSLPKGTPNLVLDNEDDNEDEINDDDDGLHAENLLSPLDDGSFGDDEEVDVAANSHAWKIDHTKGQHKLRGGFFDHGADGYGAC
jgi:hypothetical protein